VTEHWLTKAQFREVARICCPTMSVREFNIAWAEALLTRKQRKEESEKGKA
jgi:hypothetical protein